MYQFIVSVDLTPSPGEFTQGQFPTTTSWLILGHAFPMNFEGIEVVGRSKRYLPSWLILESESRVDAPREHRDSEARSLETYGITC